MATSEPMMLRSRSSGTCRPRLPTLRHSGSFGRCSGSICFAWLLLAVSILFESGESSRASVVAVSQNCSNLIEAVADFMRALGVQDMAIQDWMEAAVSQPGAEVEITDLPVEPLTDTSAPATASSEATPTSRPHSDDGRTPAADTPSSAQPCTGPLDEAAITFFRNLSREEKASRLMQAALEGAVEEVRALLAAGADVGARDGKEWTALHHAAAWGRVEAARCLLQAGAEVDARGSGGQHTPLHWAAADGYSAVARLLLAASADPNARDVDGWTPLHIAAEFGHAEVAAELLEAGADGRARDDMGRTPLDLARWKNHHQLKQMLERY